MIISALSQSCTEITKDKYIFFLLPCRRPSSQNVHLFCKDLAKIKHLVAAVGARVGLHACHSAAWGQYLAGAGVPRRNRLLPLKRQPAASSYSQFPFISPDLASAHTDQRFTPADFCAVRQMCASVWMKHVWLSLAKPCSSHFSGCTFIIYLFIFSKQTNRSWPTTC